MESLRQIITRSTVASGKYVLKRTDVLSPEVMIDEVLGIQVANHRVFGHPGTKQVVVEGQYDLNVWFASGEKTDVLKETIQYREIVAVNELSGRRYDPDETAVVTVTEGPIVMDYSLQDGKVHVTLEIILEVDIQGQARMWIRTYHAPSVFEDGKKEEYFDQFIDEEFDDFEEDI